MLSCDPHSFPSTFPLHVLLVAFQESTLPLSCRLVFDVFDPKPTLEWVSSIQCKFSQIKAHQQYDIVLIDCRRDGDEWKAISQIRQDSQQTAILGLLPNLEDDPSHEKKIEDAIGYRVVETMVAPLLRWMLQHAYERKKILFEQEQLRSQLSEASYKIELADVASTVLHNVGNVLTSVTVAANVVESVIDQSSVTLVNRTAELITNHQEDLGTYLTEDPRGKRIPSSLEKIGAHLVKEQQILLKEMKGLVRNIRHMKQVISSHQALAKSEGQVEQIALGEVFTHAMELSFQPEDEKWMTIHCDFHEVPTVLVDHHQLLQILVNLLRNAKQAMRHYTREHHELHLSLSFQDIRKTSVLMTIQDTGVGIAPEHLSQMFTRGFTTKKDGNGIGLHSSIIAIQKLGGSMHVHSKGVGEGATFTLTFPVQSEMGCHEEDVKKLARIEDR